jgi:hypothetical protein
VSIRRALIRRLERDRERGVPMRTMLYLAIKAALR